MVPHVTPGGLMTIPLNSEAPTFKIGDLVLIHTGWGATEKIGLVVETEGPGPYDYRVYVQGEMPAYVSAASLTLLSEGKTGEV